MWLTIFGKFLFFTCVYGEVISISEGISETHERTLYGVHQLARDAAERIQAVKTIDEGKEYLINNDVQNYVKLLNVLNIIPSLIKSVGDVSNSTCYADLLYFKDNINLQNIFNSWAGKIGFGLQGCLLYSLQTTFEIYHWNIFYYSVLQVSSSVGCIRQHHLMNAACLLGFYHKQVYRHQVADSFGKPESGILEGNTKWVGDFDECRSVYAPKKKDSDVGGFHGQYCTLGVTVMKFLPLSIGVCLPDTCNPSEFTEIFNISRFTPALNQSGIEVNITSLTCKASSLELSDGGVVTLIIIFTFVFLVFLGSSITAFKYLTDSSLPKDSCYADEEQKSGHMVNGSLEELVANEGFTTKLKVFIDKCDPFLNCFCVFTNGSKLLNTDSTEGQLLCLHGIRFLSMTWVIVCHVYISPVYQLRSMKGLLPLVDSFPFQAILNGWYSVDSFFVLSGFLMAYLYFQECAKNKGKMPWIYFYIHRYLRLTPVYMIVLAFVTTVMPLMGSGPFWPDFNVNPTCQKRWWWNLLYINNFKDMSDQCMGWSWYLANDMQFFVISPLFLITLWRWPKIGYSVIALFLFGSWLCGFFITYHYDLIAGSLSYVSNIEQNPNFMNQWMDYFNKIYTKPYTRIAPYLIGIGLGYILFKRKVTNIKVDRNHLLIGWVLAVSVGLYCVYGIYHQTPSLLAASFFNALTRTGYGLSLSWLIFVCLLGQGGVVDKILSYKLFIPLSRLTYSAYLIHPIFISLYFPALRTTFVFTHQTIILLFLGLLLVTYAFSFLVSLFFESPIIRLEKLIRNKFQNR